MEQLTKNQAVATSQEAVQNQNEPQLRDENAHNDKSVHGVLNPTYQAGLRRDAVQPDIEAERKKRDEIKLCLIFKLAPSVCRMTFPILASLLVRLVVLLPFQLLRLSLATPSRWTPLALSVFLHCVVALLLTLL